MNAQNNGQLQKLKVKTTMHSLKWLKLRQLTVLTVDENRELRKLSHTAGWTVKWDNYFRKHFDIFSNCQTFIYSMT